MESKIDKVMGLLKKHYDYKKRTTLNSMRGQNPFKILIACLISLRTRDENTEKVTKKLFSVAETPEAILKLSKRKLENLIYSSGYYKNKAKTLKHVSKEILTRFKGKVPDTEEELLSMKGIGRKTANVVLNFAFNKLAIPVDVNVNRISNRLGLVKAKNPDKTEFMLKKILPKKFWREINALFILHGRNICKPISPLCSECPVNNYCKKVGVKRNR